MSVQTKLQFNVRKNSSRTQTLISKHLREKENDLSCHSPTWRSSRICLSVDPSANCLTNSAVDNDEATFVEAKLLSPSKRKIKNCEAHSSPPKVSCPVDSRCELTPSTRLTCLSLNSPESKPAIQIEHDPDKTSRKELFPDKQDTADNEFQKARMAFHTSSTDNLPGREAELAELKEFLTNHINNGTSGSIYISGPPGTGKTACLSHLMNQKEIKGHFQTVYINCTSMKSPGALYSHIAKQLNLKIRGRLSEKTYLSAIEKYLSSKRRMHLFVFDELDQLESRNQSVLYTVFEWPITHPEGLVLVGVANALDLTDRTLPRLRAREDLAPRLLHFAPYSRQQIVTILKTRLEEAGVGDVFSAPALQMLASKVATVSGDVRRALDIGRRVIEMAGNPFHDNPQPVPMKTVLKPTENQISVPRSPTKMEIALKSPSKSSSPSKLLSPRKVCSPSKVCSPRKMWTSPRKLLLSPTKSNASVPDSKGDSPRKSSHRQLFQSPARKTVDLKGVMTVVGQVYGSSQSIGHGADELPLQQKLAVCTLMLILKNGKSKEVTVAKLHEVYRRVCNKRKFEPLDQAAFLSMLSLIEARGLLAIQGKGKASRLSKVCLKWVEDEVVAALKDKDLLASILKDVACLS